MDDEAVISTAGSPNEAFGHLLQLNNLAPYVMSADALSQAGQWAEHLGCADEYSDLLSPTANRQLGACVALFVCNKPFTGKHARFFADSFGLPLIWVDEHEDSNLPAGIRALEKIIIGLFSPRAKSDSDRNLGAAPRLTLAVDHAYWQRFIEATGLHPDKFACESAFVPLAAAFIQKLSGGMVDWKVYATGAYSTPKSANESAGGDGSAICAVNDIGRKRQLVARLGGKAFFVPAENLEHLTPEQKSATGGLEICSLDRSICSPDVSETNRVRNALLPLLRRLSIPPDAHAPLQEHERYIEEITSWADNTTQSEYYREKILPIEVRLLTEKYKQQAPTPRVYALVAVVEASKPNVCEILVRSMELDATKCLLFVFGHDALPPVLDDAQQVRLPEKMPFDMLTKQIGDAVKHWWPPGESVAADRVAFDVTAGTKIMTLAMIRVAAQFRAKICYLESPKFLEKCKLPIGEKSILLLDALTCSALAGNQLTAGI